MADDLKAALTSEGLPEDVIQVAIDGGWTASAFKNSVETQTELEAILDEIFPGVVLTRLQKSQIRAVWASMQAPAASISPSTTVASSAADGSWVESFAPKMSSSKLSELKQQFLRSYPSEILTPSTLPSMRLSSLAAHQEAKHEYKWIPWKLRMSDERASELLISRPAKQPRLEMLGLPSLILDEPPSIEISDGTMGVSGVQRILAVHDTALAMVGSAHLARLKAYSSKFVHLLSQRFDPASGLRPPSISEAQQADCRMWQCIYALGSDKGWTLNDALHEYTEVRGELSTLLQARPKPAQVKGGETKGKGKLGKLMATAFASGGGKNTGKGKGKEKGPGAGKGRDANAPGRHISFVKEIQVGSERKGLCVQWQMGRCSRGSGCPWIHACAYPRQDGSACGSKSHTALQHEQTPH
ncbi:unnamed protein product [Symbiodinium sp. CCMP2592]|nr:unnamed protein product [Symbiodinium sp. CCMP2592]